jgi:protein-disulfide isomerase
MMKVLSEEKSQTSKQDYLKIISHTYNMTCPFCAKLVDQIPIVTYVNDFGNESVYHPACYEAAFGVSAEMSLLDST